MNRSIFYILGVIVVIVIVLKLLGLFLEVTFTGEFEPAKNCRADAHCRDGKRFVAHSDEKLTAFLEFRRFGLAGNLC